MWTTRDIKLVWIFGILKRVVWGMTLLPYWRLGSFSCHLLEKAGSWTYSKTCLIYVAVQKWRLTKKPKSWNFRAIFAGTHSPGKTGEVWDSKWSTSSDYIDATRSHMLSGRKVEIRVLLTLIQNVNTCHTNWSFCTGPNFSGKIDQQQPKEINSQSSESFLVIKIEIWGFECMESRTR